MMLWLPVAVMKMSARPRPRRRCVVDLVAFHRRLQRADRVDLGDDDAAALAAQRLRAALADFAEAEHHRDLAAEHDVGRAREAVGQRVAAAVDVVELALGDRVVDVDRREEQRARFHHLIQAVHAGRRLLADAAQSTTAMRVQRPLSFAIDVRISLEDDAPLFGILVGVERRHLAGLLELDALVHQQRRVAAIVDDQRRAAAVGPLERLLVHHQYSSSVSPFHANTGVPFGFCGGAAVLRTADHDRRGGVILGREDVARHPAHVGAELDQRLDQDRGLNRHVQAAHDPGAGERLLRAVLLAQRHQPGHLLLGEPHFLAAELGQRQVRDLERFAAGRLRGLERVHLLGYCCHLSLSFCCDATTVRRCRVFAESACLRPVATNNPGPLRAASGGSGTIRIVLEPGLLQHAAHVLVA